MVCEIGIVAPYKYIIVNKLMNTVIRFICLFAVYMLFCRVYVILPCICYFACINDKFVIVSL